MLVDFHEIAERHRKDSVLGGRERIDAERVFEPRDQDGKAKRIETAIGKHEIFLQRRKNLAVFAPICSICSIMVNLTDMAGLPFVHLLPV